MTGATPSLTPELLLAEADFVRGLARSLLDPEQAEDVVQETWIAAMRQPAGRVHSMRAWLARVVRNRSANERRAARRRAQREQAAARAEAVPSADEIVAREQARHAVVEALLRLPEPYRGTLLLRFYEDLQPAEIAERLGLPGATVRSRLARGLAQLREQLDRCYGGDRRAWGLLLLPLARPERAVAGTLVTKLGVLTGVLLTMKTLLAVAVALVALAAFWLLDEEPQTVPFDPQVAAETQAAAPSGAAAPADGIGRAPIETTQRVEAPRAANAPAAVAGLRGRLLLPDGAPAAGTPVEVVGLDALGFLLDMPALGAQTLEQHATESGPDGRFEFRELLPRGRFALRAGHGGDFGAMQWIAATPGPDQVTDVGDVQLTARGGIRGQIVDADGVPVAGAAIMAGDIPTFALAALPLERLEPDHGGLLMVPAPSPEELAGDTAYRARVRSYLAGKLFMETVEPGPEYVVLPARVPRGRRELLDWLPLARATSDAEGRFELRGLVPGITTLIARQDGSKPGVQSGLRVAAGSMRDVGTVRLDAAESLEGRVVDAGGAPVVGARVRLASVPRLGLRGVAVCEAELRTDADGRFAADGLEDADLFAAVQPRAGDSWFVVGPEPIDAAWQITLPPRQDLLVELADAQGKLLQPAEVELYAGPQVGELASFVLERELDLRGRVDPAPDGQVCIRSLLPGIYVVAVRVDGHVPVQRMARIPATEPLRITCAPAQPLRIAVTDSAGAPVADARILAWPLDPDAQRVPVLPTSYDLPRWRVSPELLGTTDRRGVLETMSLPAGRHCIAAIHTRLGQVEQVLTLPGGEATLAFPALGTIEGFLLDGGRPASAGQWRLVAERESDGDGESSAMPWPEAHALPGPDGAFRFQGLAPGVWELTVRPALARCDSLGDLAAQLQDAIYSWPWVLTPGPVDRAVVLQPGETRQVTLDCSPPQKAVPAPGEIAGIVILDGAAGQSLEVHVTQLGMVPKRVQTDEAGRFQVRGLKEGQYDVEVKRQEACLAAERVRVTEQAPAELTIRVETGAVRGVVIQPAGAPLAGARAFAVRSAPGGNMVSVAPVAADGTFCFEALPVGEHRVQVQGDHLSGTAGAIQVQPGPHNPQLEVRVERRYVIDGKILGAEPRQYVELQERPAGARSATTTWVRMAEEGGGFRFGGLEPGRYLLRAYGTDMKPEGAQVEVLLRDADRTIELGRDR